MSSTFAECRRDIIAAIERGTCRSGRTMFEPDRNPNRSYCLTLDVGQRRLFINRESIDDYVGSFRTFTHAQLAARVEAGDFLTIGYRLHQTNVVEFNTDGDCRINWYDSDTTNNFISEYAPQWIRTNCGRSYANYSGLCQPDAMPVRFRRAGRWLAIVEYGGKELELEASGLWLRKATDRYNLGRPMLVEPLEERRCWTDTDSRWELTREGKAELKRVQDEYLPALEAARQMFLGALATGVSEQQRTGMVTRAYDDARGAPGFMSFSARQAVENNTYRKWLREETTKNLLHAQWAKLVSQQCNYTTGEVRHVE